MDELNTENPYAAPTSESSQVAESNVPLMELARSTFLEWEKLRIVFVLLLGTITLLVTGAGLLRIKVLLAVVEGALIANVCYFAGPILETYVRWLGYRGKWLRWILFYCGTFMTALVAVLALAYIKVDK